MSATKTTKAKARAPADLLEATAAADVALCSPRQLLRYAAAGVITRYARPGLKRSVAFYSRAEILEKLTPRAA
jgi:hypothetical protein